MLALKMIPWILRGRVCSKSLKYSYMKRDETCCLEKKYISVPWAVMGLKSNISLKYNNEQLFPGFSQFISLAKSQYYITFHKE